MDTNIGVIETVASSTESDIPGDATTPSTTNESLVFDEEKKIDPAVETNDTSTNECLHTNTTVMAVVHSEKDVIETLVNNETQPAPLETAEVVTNTSETIATSVVHIDAVENFDTSLNSSSNMSDNITGKDNDNMQKSSDDGDVELLSIDETNQKESGKIESTSTEEIENISNEETVPQNRKETIFEKNIESSIEDRQTTSPSSNEQITETNASNELNVEGTTEEINVNLPNTQDENIQRPTEGLHLETPLEDVKVTQDVVNTELDKLGTVEEQLQSIHNSDLPNESINEITDQELSTTTQENEEVIEQHEPSIEDIEENLESLEENNTNDVELDTSDNLVVTTDVTTPSINVNNVKTEPLSSIKNEQPAPPVPPKLEEGISIVEAISRDFDEIDSEDIDKPETSEEQSTIKAAADDVVAGVNIRDQLQHGTVTVTDTSGQVYYVQSVEDIIVVENDVPTTLEQPNTIEVTVLSEVDDPEETQIKHAPREKPPIPSHILGRNIENPVIDTFRNGKVPPKPRLGVKIPYKNLTSQIVSKDELAQEILERQRQKHKQHGQTTREMLFAKKLTQRLAKKIAPTEGSPDPVEEEVTIRRTAKDKDNTINNSDLLAILEGDGEDSELRKSQEADGISSTDVNISESGTSKILSAVKESTLQKTEFDRKQKSPMSKITEREIALRQLKELPVGTRRRRGKLITNNSFEITVVENELNIQGVVPSRNTLVQNDKEDLVKKLQPKISGNSNNNPKLVQSQANIERKEIIACVPDKIESKCATKEINDVDAMRIEQSDIKQAHNNSDKDKQFTTKPESEDVNAKTCESGQMVDNECELIESTKTKSDIKQKVCHALPKIEHVESHIKTKDVEQESQIIDVTVIAKLKSNEINPISAKSGDKSKKIELPTKSPAKIIEGKIKDPLPKEEFVERKHVGNPPIKTYTRKRKSTEDISVVSSVPDKKIAISQKSASIPPNTYVTKSSRIIKRKVIWDPDEPSTARSLVTRSPKADPLKLEKPVKPDVTVIRVDRKSVMKTVMKSDIVKSPIKSPDSQKIKKRLSEVDRLLMDEGAVNMLYAVKNVDDVIKKKKTNVISLDKAQKELINKTNELKKDLKTNSDKVSPKSLRRKDSPVPTPTKKMVPASLSRKKSKDSSRSSLHSPPSSPSMMFSNHAEASRIIRRHSSSSYSSMEGEFDDKKIDSDVIQTQTSTSTDQEKLSKKRIASGNIEGIKLKKAKRNVEKESVITAEDGKTDEETFKHFNKLIEIVELKYDKYKTFSVKQIDHMVQIILLPSFNNEAYLTPEILNELCGIMKELQEDTNCTVVVISSSASSFCHGINYKTLLNDKEQSRKAFARKLATCVTNFLRILATFPKILVAGVHGDTVGAGVTVLPLFDMVIASDTATFSIPNARLGCAAEGGSLLSLPHLMHNVLVSELLYASRKLIAAEALRLGMVTRVLWPDKFQQELVSIVKSISNQSSQFMVLTKKQLRQHMMEHIEEALSKEVDTLVQHWTSAECQKNFGVYG